MYPQGNIACAHFVRVAGAPHTIKALSLERLIEGLLTQYTLPVNPGVKHNRSLSRTFRLSGIYQLESGDQNKRGINNNP